MNNTGSVIKQGGQAVAAVFSGSGGFVLNVQPPFDSYGLTQTFIIKGN
jgi:hypothetical protein